MNWGKYLASVAIATVAMLAAFDVASTELIRKKVEPADNINPALALLRNTHSTAAAFGDSRLAFDYTGLPSVVNLAYPGESVEDMAFRADTWLRNQPHPKFAIVEADPHLFSVYRSGGGTKSYLTGQKQGWLATIFPVDSHHWPLVTIYWRKFLLQGGIKASKFRFQPSGWQANPEKFTDLSPEEQVIWARGRVQQHEPVENFAQTREAHLYEELVAKLRNAGARLCFVTTPMSYAYTADADGRTRFAQARAYFANVAAKGGDRYVDLSHVYDKPSNVGLFADSDHLNENAAPLFSQMVNERCGSEM